MSRRQRMLTVGLIVGALACLACPGSPRHSNTQPAVSNSNIAAVPEANNDYAISAHIQTALAERGFSDVAVSASGGQVNLSGYVDDDEQRLAAEEIAIETPGVAGVTNNIVVCKRPPVNLNKPGGPRKC